MPRLRSLIAAGCVAASLATATMASAAPSYAGIGTDGSAESHGDGGSVHIGFSGTAVSGNPSATTSSSVPPDCWFEYWQTLEDGVKFRRAAAVFESFFPFIGILLRLHPLSYYEDAWKAHKKDPGWHVDQLKCKPDISTIDSEQALSTAGTTEWFGLQVAYRDLILGPGDVAPGGVSVRTLLDEAEKAFTIPVPDVQHSPTLTANGGATLVNADTWFWAPNAQRSYTITATAGPVSVTLTAKNSGYVLTSPYGSTQCTREQFTTPWSKATQSDPDAGCRLTFTTPSTGAGHEVQISSSWDVSWTGTGGLGGDLDPITPSTTIRVPVVEAGTTVTGTS